MKTNVPKPVPEVKKLGYFVGKWITTGTIASGPWGGGGKFAGGKFSWTETTQWMTGNFSVVGHWDFTMPAELGGDGEELFVMGYDPREHVYTFDAFSSQGLHQVSKGTLHMGTPNGDTWIWDSDGIQAGTPVKQKMTMRVFSRTRYTLKFEISNDGANWSTFMEGKATKQKVRRRPRSSQ
jgi:hypothetical protein